MPHRLLAPLVAVLLSGCGLFGPDEPTVIDGSSQEAFEQSLAAARRDLGPAERLKFEAAWTEYRGQMFAKADNRQEYQQLLREGMDGLTAPMIVAQFDKDVDRIGNDAADAIFDAKRAVSGGGS
jgi:hypothetical protein